MFQLEFFWGIFHSGKIKCFIATSVYTGVYNGVILITDSKLPGDRSNLFSLCNKSDSFDKDLG